MLYVLQPSQVCSVTYFAVECGAWKYSRSELPPMAYVWSVVTARQKKRAAVP